MARATCSGTNQDPLGRDNAHRCRLIARPNRDRHHGRKGRSAQKLHVALSCTQEFPTSWQDPRKLRPAPLLLDLRPWSSNQHPIAVLSDQNLFREGLVELLRYRGFDHVEEYTSSRLLFQTTCTPAVLLVDLDHTQEDTMTLLRSLRRELPTTHIVAIGSPPRQEAAGSSKTDGRLETPVANAVPCGFC